MPFVFWHWVVNDDTCGLTLVEMYVTGKPKMETFFGRLLKPIYKISEHQSHVFISTLYLCLWIFVQYRLDRIPLTPNLVKELM